MHNSLVGVNTIVCSPFPGLIFSSIGKQNAIVFPDPVSACPTTSFNLMISGIHFSCIGVSCSNPCLFVCSIRWCLRLRSSNFIVLCSPILYQLLFFVFFMLRI